ncbi:Tat pathway signal sequence domain protein [Streptomyces coriariae]|uniref:Tat pathway signal sequence domain protein n=1 Tax=Streptomyces coriariae TaxID=2864460 RepID=UPI001E3FAF1D|nr:Tat pathway signal sequence domain protein [Streptomyces coriariae]
MRLKTRTGLAALVVAGAALMAGAAPALADGGTPTPGPTTADRSATPAPAEDGTDATPAPAPTEAGTAPSAVPSQVGVVPRGGADTGVEEPSEGRGGLIGGSAAAVFAAAGTGFYVVRRRRATGA